VSSWLCCFPDQEVTEVEGRIVYHWTESVATETIAISFTCTTKAGSTTDRTAGRTPGLRVGRSGTICDAVPVSKPCWNGAEPAAFDGASITSTHHRRCWERRTNHGSPIVHWNSPRFTCSSPQETEISVHSNRISETTFKYVNLNAISGLCDFETATCAC
jgi:hypothetical protein